jgi:hypothetical protein
MMGSCAPTNVPSPAAVTFDVNPTITSPSIPATVVSVGQERPVGLLRGSDGVTEGFVIDEVMVRAETQEELDTFLAKYGGTLLSDGTASNIPEDMRVVDVPSTNWYLVRVDLSMSSVEDLPANVEAAGIEGHLEFSSDDAARLISVVAREAPNGAWPNLLMYATSSLEHPDYSNGNLDAEFWKWMTEDDDPNSPGDQGLSVGVIRAWDYLAYRNVPPTPPPGGTVTFAPTRVALVDNGFALDQSTGRPLLNNVDFYNSTGPPLQWDVADNDRRAGSTSSDGLDGGAVPWHGQKAFGVCCAAERNKFGGAGIAGPVAQPILIRSGGTIYSIAEAILTAATMGAQVINISMGGECGVGCRLADIFWDNRISDVAIAATEVGAVVLAGAGNAGSDLDTGYSFIPCEVYGVICVGSILRENAISTRIKTRHNYGQNVAISAPEGVIDPGIFSTLTPDAVAADPDNFANALPDQFNEDELGVFASTSCATAFASGVVALMKAANPSLDWTQVRDILQATANRPESLDNRVPNGYVDAFRAVAASMSPNQPPIIEITQPVSSQVIGWKTQPFFKVFYSDPEVDPNDLTALLRFPGQVVITSNVDGELCRDDSLPYECTSTLGQLTLGDHVVSATATDAFGATTTHDIKILVVNRPPQPEIVAPLPTAALYSHIPIQFLAFVPDPDETILQENVTWTSDLDGDLGTGIDVLQNLTAGTHTITLHVVDGLGLSATDQVTVTVQPGAGAPTPVITSHLTGTLVGPGQMITLTGQATDPEDGMLSGTKLQWSSNIDGVLGSGESIQVILSSPPIFPCGIGAVHEITLKATDSDGKAVTVTILINVGTLC